MIKTGALIQRGNKQVTKWAWNPQTSKTVDVDYEVYFDLDYMERYLRDVHNHSINRCINRAAYAASKQSTAGPIKVLTSEHKKYKPSLKPFGKPKVVLVATIVETEQLISEHFGQSYDILAGEAYGSKKAKTYVIDKDDNLDYTELGSWKVSGNGEFLLKHLLTVMAIEGVILPGTYLVEKS